jgi:hypothetical protein
MDFLSTLRRDAFPPVDIHGWCDEPNFIRTFDSLVPSKSSPPLIIVEVGTWKGKSACMMASHLKSRLKKASIVCIDTWLGAPEFWTWGLDDPSRGISLDKRMGYPRVYETFIHNVKTLGHDDMIVPLPLSSIQAARVLKHHNVVPDIVYIDAAHEEDAVYADLEAFFPLGTGVMFGDDYVAWPGVRRAVDDFVKKHDLALSVSGEVWCVTKKNQAEH